MSKKKLTNYVNKQAIREVLGCLIQTPKLLREYKISKSDFPEDFHKLIFAAINNLYKNGIENIDAVAIDEYLSHYETQYKIFEKNQGIEFINNIEELSTVANIKYYYEQLKKFSLLRRYMEHGIDVSDFFNPNEIDPVTIESQQEKLDSSSIQDIINHFKKKHLEVVAPFSIGEGRDTKKAGVGGMEQKERWKKDTAWGIGYSSAYLTTVLHGLRRRRFNVKSAGTGVGKAIPNYTIIPTPNGYKTVGEIKKGDFLFGQDGEKTKVLEIYPQLEKKQVYKITFSDGRTAECCKEHLWTYIYEGHRDKKYRTESVEDIIKRSNGNYQNKKGGYKYKIPLNEPIKYSEKQYSIEPYILGLLLGDGSFRYSKRNKSLSFSSKNEELPSAIAKSLNCDYKKNNANYSYTFGKQKKNLWTTEILKDYPELWQTKSETKFIPRDYLEGSIEQRYNLLAGLLDTDGSIEIKGRITYTTISPLLRDNVIEICRSLGMIATYFIDKREEKYMGNKCYIINIQCKEKEKIKLFKLLRKVEIAKSYLNNNKRKELKNYIAIKNIEILNKYEDMTCFTVDNESHLFLMNDFIVTHNTRTTIADIGYSCSPAYYDKSKKAWIKNSNGINNAGLYIGTEMELLEEIDPILWAYIADVPQEHIEFNMYEDDEEERVDEAIRILEEDANIWFEYLPNYDSEMLAEVIEEHKIQHNISYVWFDYIHATVELTAEFGAESKVKMVVREDQILASLSNKLKRYSRKFDVSIEAGTQVNDKSKDEKNRDETIVRGSKALIDKADGAMIAMPPTEKELKKIEPILRNLLNCPTPNLVYSIYKNRGGKWNKVKIWLYIDYDTMRTYDLFVTDYEYKIDSEKVKGLNKTYINIEDDEIISNTPTVKIADKKKTQISNINTIF